MTTPFDCDADPERFRLATRVTRRHLTAGRTLYELLAETLAGTVRGASWTSAAGKAPCGRPCRPLWPRGRWGWPWPGGVVFGQVEVQRWDAPLLRLPDREAIRD